MNNEGMGSWGFLAFLIFAIFAFGGNGSQKNLLRKQ